MSERAMARDYCYRCFKSARLCVCDIEAVENQTEVFIVQHPAERQHPINTARLTVLGLTRARIDVEWNREIAAPQNLPEHSVVLFPSSHSRDLESYAPEERPQGLVVLDGTWSQARKLYLRNSWLQELPHVHLKPSAPSRYRIRKQPREGYLSTLEATVAALKILEPDGDRFDRLLNRFDEMIETQSRFVDNPPPGAYRHMRAELPGRAPRAPDACVHWDDLVMVYGDFLAGRGDSTQPVAITMERVRTGERQSLLFKGDTLHPAPHHLAHMGIHPAQYESAAPVTHVRERLNSFLEASDVLCAWNSVTARKVLAASGTELPHVSLKSDFCNWSKSTCGHLEDVIDDLRHDDSRVSRPAHTLRSERRLAEAVEVLHWLRRNVSAVLRKYS